MPGAGHEVTITIPRSPDVVFAHLLQVQQWWGGRDLSGPTNAVGDVFIVRHGDAHYSRQRVVEVVPEKRIVWEVMDSTLNWLARDRHEWTGTRMVFELFPQGEGTELRFTHEGLVPAMECYTRCAEGWNTVITTWLFRCITEGRTV